MARMTTCKRQSRQIMRSLSDVLVGKRWQARSHTLAGQGLVIAFMPNGRIQRPAYRSFLYDARTASEGQVAGHRATAIFGLRL